MVRAAILALASGVAVLRSRHRARARRAAIRRSGRAVFTGATMPSATSIELNPGRARPRHVATRSTSRRRRARSVSGSIDALDLDTAHRARRARPTTPSSRPAAMLASSGTPAIASRSASSCARRRAELFLEDQRRAALPHARRRPARRTSARVGASIQRHRASSTSARASSHENTYLHAALRARHRARAGDGADGVDSDCGGAPCGVENPLRDRALRRRRRTPMLSRRRTSCVEPRRRRAASRATSGSALAYHTPPGLEIQTELDGTMTSARAARRRRASVNGGVDRLRPATRRASTPSCARGCPTSSISTSACRWEDLSRMPGVRRARLRLERSRARASRSGCRAPRGFHDPFALWAGVEQVDARHERAAAVRRAPRLRDRVARRRRARAARRSRRPRSPLDVGVQLRLRARARSSSSRTACSTSRRCTSPNSAFDPRAQLDCIDIGLRLLDGGVRGGAQRLRDPDRRRRLRPHPARAAARAPL